MIFSDEILKKRIIGIDYGNKFSGATVMCYNAFDKIRFIRSSKNSDADEFILREVFNLKPDFIFIDAPLSLPGVYRQVNGYSDYFYRNCDREMKAMSPMFLGGLSARAMKLTKQLSEKGFGIFETYPRKMIEILSFPGEIYKQKIEDLDRLLELFVIKTNICLNKNLITTWHHFDAMLAFFSGIRYVNGESIVYGKADEGLVYV